MKEAYDSGEGKSTLGSDSPLVERERELSLCEHGGGTFIYMIFFNGICNPTHTHTHTLYICNLILQKRKLMLRHSHSP